MAWSNLTLPKQPMGDKIPIELLAPNLPPGSLPAFKRLPFDAKLPLPNIPTKEVILTYTNIGRSKYITESGKEFYINDPHNVDHPPIEYCDLNDPNLKHYFANTKRFKNLVKRGLVTPDGRVRCSLAEYNTYRRYLYKLWGIKVNRLAEAQVREERIQMESQLANYTAVKFDDREDELKELEKWGRKLRSQSFQKQVDDQIEIDLAKRLSGSYATERWWQYQKELQDTFKDDFPKVMDWLSKKTMCYRTVTEQRLKAREKRDKAINKHYRELRESNRRYLEEEQTVREREKNLEKKLKEKRYQDFQQIWERDRQRLEASCKKRRNKLQVECQRTQKVLNKFRDRKEDRLLEGTLEKRVRTGEMLSSTMLFIKGEQFGRQKNREEDTGLLEKSGTEAQDDGVMTYLDREMKYTNTGCERLSQGSLTSFQEDTVEEEKLAAITANIENEMKVKRKSRASQSLGSIFDMPFPSESTSTTLTEETEDSVNDDIEKIDTARAAIENHLLSSVEVQFNEDSSDSNNEANALATTPTPSTDWTLSDVSGGSEKAGTLSPIEEITEEENAVEKEGTAAEESAVEKTLPSESVSPETLDSVVTTSELVSGDSNEITLSSDLPDVDERETTQNEVATPVNENETFGTDDKTLRDQEDTSEKDDNTLESEGESRSDEDTTLVTEDGTLEDKDKNLETGIDTSKRENEAESLDNKGETLDGKDESFETGSETLDTTDIEREMSKNEGESLGTEGETSETEVETPQTEGETSETEAETPKTEDETSGNGGESLEGGSLEGETSGTEAEIPQTEDETSGNGGESLEGETSGTEAETPQTEDETSGNGGESLEGETLGNESKTPESEDETSGNEGEISENEDQTSANESQTSGNESETSESEGKAAGNEEKTPGNEYTVNFCHCIYYYNEPLHPAFSKTVSTCLERDKRGKMNLSAKSDFGSETGTLPLMLENTYKSSQDSLRRLSETDAKSFRKNYHRMPDSTCVSDSEARNKIWKLLEKSSRERNTKRFMLFMFGDNTKRFANSTKVEEKMLNNSVSDSVKKPQEDIIRKIQSDPCSNKLEAQSFRNGGFTLLAHKFHNACIFCDLEYLEKKVRLKIRKSNIILFVGKRISVKPARRMNSAPSTNFTEEEKQLLIRQKEVKILRDFRISPTIQQGFNRMPKDHDNATLDKWEVQFKKTCCVAKYSDMTEIRSQILNDKIPGDTLESFFEQMLGEKQTAEGNVIGDILNIKPGPFGDNPNLNKLLWVRHWENNIGFQCYWTYPVTNDSTEESNPQQWPAITSQPQQNNSGTENRNVYSFRQPLPFGTLSTTMTMNFFTSGQRSNNFQETRRDRDFTVNYQQQISFVFRGSPTSKPKETASGPREVPPKLPPLTFLEPEEIPSETPFTSAHRPSSIIARQIIDGIPKDCLPVDMLKYYGDREESHGKRLVDYVMRKSRLLGLAEHDATEEDMARAPIRRPVLALPALQQSETDDLELDEEQFIPPQVDEQPALRERGERRRSYDVNSEMFGGYVASLAENEPFLCATPQRDDIQEETSKALSDFRQVSNVRDYFEKYMNEERVHLIERAQDHRRLAVQKDEDDTDETSQRELPAGPEEQSAKQEVISEDEEMPLETTAAPSGAQGIQRYPPKTEDIEKYKVKRPEVGKRVQWTPGTPDKEKLKMIERRKTPIPTMTEKDDDADEVQPEKFVYTTLDKERARLGLPSLGNMASKQLQPKLNVANLERAVPGETRETNFAEIRRKSRRQLELMSEIVPEQAIPQQPVPYDDTLTSNVCDLPDTELVMSTRSVQTPQGTVHITRFVRQDFLGNLSDDDDTMQMIQSKFGRNP